MLNMILNFIFILMLVYGIIGAFRLFRKVKAKNIKIRTVLYLIFAGAYSFTAIVFALMVAYATAAFPDFNIWTWFIQEGG